MTPLSQPNKYTQAVGRYSNIIRLGFSCMCPYVITKTATARISKKESLNKNISIFFIHQPFCFIQVF